MAGTGSEKQGHQAGSSSQPSQSNAPQIVGSASDIGTDEQITKEKQDDGPINGDGNDGNSSYTVTVNMLGGKTTKLQFSHGDTVMEVRQHLQKILGSDAFTSYTLQLRDKKDDSVRRLEHYDTISDVADISTGEFQLEMVPVSSSLARNTSSNLKDGNDGNSSYAIIVEMLSGETTKLQCEMGEKGDTSNVPPAGTSASDAIETCKHIASESPSTGPDPPEVQESENIAIEGPNEDGGENEEEQPRGVAPLLVHDESDLALVLHHVGGDINNANMQQEDHSETAQRILEVGESSRRLSKLRPIRHPNHQHQQDELTMPPSLFEIGEIVIAHWCQGLYRARVLGKYLYEGGLWRYYIVYYENGEEPKEKKDKDTEYTQGRNNQPQVVEPEDKWEGFKPWVGWNQWVIEIRLLRASQENLNLMAETESKLTVSWIVYPTDLEEEDDPIAEDRMRLEDNLGVHIPSSLYISWIEDGEISLHLGKIIDIAKPITWTVDQIIIDFGNYHQRIMGPSDDQFDETLQRMIRHFEAQLASLLYESEKHNLPHHWPSRIYGGEHLLRMLVSLDNGIFGPPILPELFRYLDIHHNQVFNVERVDANGDARWLL